MVSKFVNLHREPYSASMFQGYPIFHRILRACFYVLSIGGMLLVFTAVLWFVWNNFATRYYHYPSLSPLESVGLIAIAYVFYSALRFASGSDAIFSDKQQNQSTKSPGTDKHGIVDLSRPNVPTNFTPDEQQRLLAELKRCCGSLNPDLNPKERGVIEDLET